MPPSAGDYVESNRSHWDRAAAEFAEPGRRAWGLDEPLWGIFRVPESQLGILGMHRFEWADAPTVEFHLGYGEWIRLLRANGFEVVDLIEIRPPEDATSPFPWITTEWARRWPGEEVWKARKAG